MSRLLSLALCINFLVSCQSDHQIKDEIQKSLDQCVLAVNTKDINLYMQGISDDFKIKDEHGEIITREMQREYALRDWAIIDTTLNNIYVVDSLQIEGNIAIVFTSQEWERIMFQRDGITKDTVLTTQIHNEIWKKRNQKWVNYSIEELGGKVFINGEEYTP